MTDSGPPGRRARWLIQVASPLLLVTGIAVGVFVTGVVGGLLILAAGIVGFAPAVVALQRFFFAGQPPYDDDLRCFEGSAAGIAIG